LGAQNQIEGPLPGVVSGGGEHDSCMVTDAVSLAFAVKRAGGGIPPAPRYGI
jgi:hypothetical protein